MSGSCNITFCVDYPVLRFRFSTSLRKHLQLECLFKRDRNRAAEMLEEDGYQHLDIVQRPRAAPTYDYYDYYVAMLSNIGGVGGSNLTLGDQSTA